MYGKKNMHDYDETKGIFKNKIDNHVEYSNQTTNKIRQSKKQTSKQTTNKQKSNKQKTSKKIKPQRLIFTICTTRIHLTHDISVQGDGFIPSDRFRGTFLVATVGKRLGLDRYHATSPRKTQIPIV
jgi:hypothetical protein